MSPQFASHLDLWRQLFSRNTESDFSPVAMQKAHLIICTLSGAYEPRCKKECLIAGFLTKYKPLTVYTYIYFFWRGRSILHHGGIVCAPTNTPYMALTASLPPETEGRSGDVQQTLPAYFLHKSPPKLRQSTCPSTHNLHEYDQLLFQDWKCMHSYQQF